jgi:hypothetical protein
MTEQTASMEIPQTVGPAVVRPDSDSRLSQLAAGYTDAKAAADAAAARLKEITDAIKVELTNAAPGVTKVDLVHDSLASPLRLQAKTSWRLDTPKLKENEPEIYVRYAKQSTSWELRAVGSA